MVYSLYAEYELKKNSTDCLCGHRPHCDYHQHHESGLFKNRSHRNLTATMHYEIFLSNYFFSLSLDYDTMPSWLLWIISWVQVLKISIENSMPFTAISHWKRPLRTCVFFFISFRSFVFISIKICIYSSLTNFDVIATKQPEKLAAINLPYPVVFLWNAFTEPHWKHSNIWYFYLLLFGFLFCLFRKKQRVCFAVSLFWNVLFSQRECVCVCGSLIVSYFYIFFLA